MAYFEEGSVSQLQIGNLSCVDASFHEKTLEQLIFCYIMLVFMGSLFLKKTFFVNNIPG